MKLFKTLATLLPLCAMWISPDHTNARSVFVTLNIDPADQVNNTFDATISTSGYVTVSTIFGDIQVDIANSDADSAAISGYFDTGMVIDFDQFKNAAVSSLAIRGGDLAITDTQFVFDYGILGSIVVENNDIGGYPGTYPPGIADVIGAAFNVREHYVVINHGTSTISGTGLASGMFDQALDFESEPTTPETIDTLGSLTVSYDYFDGYLDYYNVEMVIPIDIDQVMLEQADPVEGYDVQIGLVATGTVKATGSFAVNSCGYDADIADNDCLVGINDLQVMTGQWLEISEMLPCPLSAELAGNDCVVNLNDFAVLASQWITDVE